MEKIGCTIEWVNHPGVITSFLSAALFGQYSVVRVGFGQNFENRPFGFNISLADKIVTALRTDFESIELVQVH